MHALKPLIALSMLFSISSNLYAQSPEKPLDQQTLAAIDGTSTSTDSLVADWSPALAMTSNTMVSVAEPASTLASTGSGLGKRTSTPVRVPTQASSSELVTLSGHVPAVARIAAFDRGRTDSSTQLAHLQLQLKRTPSQQAALTALIADQTNASSQSYHHWLTAVEFGQRFGASDAQLEQVERWMRASGLTVEGVNEARNDIQFSATVGDVEYAFHTEIHDIHVKNAMHIAPTVEPSVPAQLADTIQGVALSDFQPHPMHIDARSLKPNPATKKFMPVGGEPSGANPSFALNYNGDEYQIVAPGDFATIYNLTPAWNAGYRGKGQTIAVVEDTEMKAADVSTFRAAFGLSSYAGTFSQEAPVGSHPCTNPGRNADEGEAALDAEWAGATAPDASILLAACVNTRTEFGGLIALENLLSQATPPPIVSLSYGYCEAEMGSIEINQFNAAYEQAVTEGVSIFVSSGDSSSAGCNDDEQYASYGIQVSGFATTPYNVAVGGTDFYDTAQGTGSQYWSTSNSSTYVSALSYVPEKTWNDSCADSDVLAYVGYDVAYGSDGFCNSGDAYNYLTTTGGSGGPSAIYLKPSWQSVYGVPADGVRDIPDVSLFSSNGFWGHLLVYCNSDTRSGGAPCTYTSATDAVYNSAGGTSFASPAMAGIFALITQKYGSQGNPNTRLYELAASEYGTQGSPSASSLAGCDSTLGSAAQSTCVFYDVTKGSSDVPCIGSDCFGWAFNATYDVVETYGALSTSTAAFSPAYPAGSGWDFATGLGSVNATNLLNNWSTDSATTVPRTRTPIGIRPIATPEPILTTPPVRMN